jgi:hypothetical protein
LIFYQFQKVGKFAESEKIFSKYLLPVHQRFSNHTTLFKQFPNLTIEAKIKLYTIKIMKNLEHAKWLSKNEMTNDNIREKFSDELMLQSIDLDYDTIHSEILENIIFDEDDSGLSDFGSNEEEKNSKKEIFNITKIKTLIHKNVKSLFSKGQEDEQYNPLIQLEKEMINKESIFKEKEIENNENIANNDIKTEENTEEFIKCKNDFNSNENIENNSTEVVFEKEKEIVNYKKYNFFTDPYSNYNNFTKKYKVKINQKKRFRDIHPFLKTFNPKFLKKENIDKKIFRRFRKFVKAYYKDNKSSPIFSKNVHFWKKFYMKNLLPPVKIISNIGEIIEHKSFNTQYLIWLFSQEGTSELFQLFSQKESENIINNFINEYNLSKSSEDGIIEKLKQYISYIPEIYDSYNNNQKKIILEENKEIFDANELNESREKKENNNNNSESFESEELTSNPFHLNFELDGKKHFKETPYDGNNFYDEKEAQFNSKYEMDNKSERFMEDSSYNEQLQHNYFK